MPTRKPMSLGASPKKKGAAPSSMLLDAVRRSIETSAAVTNPVGSKSQPNPMSLLIGRNSIATVRNLTTYENDLLPTFSVTPSGVIVVPGFSVTFTVNTKNVRRGTTLYWKIVGNATGPDFTDDQASGSFVVNDNFATFTRALKTKADRVYDANPQYVLQISRAPGDDAPVVAEAASVTIDSLSTTPAYGITTNVTSIGADQTATFDIVTNNVADGTTLYWTLGGTSQAEDFTQGTTSGSVTVTNGVAVISRTNAGFSQFNSTFTISVRTGSVSGPVVATSSTTTVVGAGLGNIVGDGTAESSIPDGPSYGFSQIVDSCVDVDSNLYVLVNVPPNTTVPVYSWAVEGGNFSTNTLWGNFVSGSVRQYAIIKYTAAGTPVWVSSAANLYPLAIGVDNAKNVYVYCKENFFKSYVGTTERPVGYNYFYSYSGGGGAVPAGRINTVQSGTTWTSVVTANLGQFAFNVNRTPYTDDLYIAKWNSAGVYQWHTRMGLAMLGNSRGILSFPAYPYGNQGPTSGKCFTVDASGNCTFVYVNNPDASNDQYFFSATSNPPIGGYSNLAALFNTYVWRFPAPRGAMIVAGINPSGTHTFVHALVPNASTTSNSTGPLSPRALAVSPVGGNQALTFTSTSEVTTFSVYQNIFSAYLLDAKTAYIGEGTIATGNFYTGTTTAHVVGFASNSLRWVARLDGASPTAIGSNSAAVGSSGDVYVTAPVTGTLSIVGMSNRSWAPTPGTQFAALYTQATIPQVGSNPSVLVKFDASGVPIAGAVVTSLSGGFATTTGLTNDASGNVYSITSAQSAPWTLQYTNFSSISATTKAVSVSTYGFANPGNAGNSIASIGDANATSTYLAKYNSNLAVQWVARATVATDIFTGTTVLSNVGALDLLPTSGTSVSFVHGVFSASSIPLPGYGVQFIGQSNVSSISVNGSTISAIIFKPFNNSNTIKNAFGESNTLSKTYITRFTT